MADACRVNGLQVIESALENVTDDFCKMADVIVCFEVIEHVFGPPDFLLGASKLLTPGGLLMVTCPNGKGFDTEILREASPSVHIEYLKLLNPQSATVLLNRAGLEVFSPENPMITGYCACAASHFGERG